MALLNVAVAGLAAERAPAPDYSETLGEIAKGVSVAVGRLGKVMTSPAFALSPADLARQIAAAGDEARRQDQALLQHAQDLLQHTARELQSRIESARLAHSQNQRLLQLGAATLSMGALLGVWLPNAIARAAPVPWAWPERLAARTLHLEPWAAGERLLAIADPQRWQTLRAQLQKGAAAPESCSTDAPRHRSQAKGRRSTGPRQPPSNR